jgi:hypothetical protein
MSAIGKKIIKYKSFSKKTDTLTQYLDDNAGAELGDAKAVASSIMTVAEVPQEYAEAAAAIARLTLKNTEQVLRKCADAQIKARDQDVHPHPMGALFLIFHICGKDELIKEYWKIWSAKFRDDEVSFLLMLCGAAIHFDVVKKDAESIRKEILKKDPELADSIVARPVDFSMMPWLSYYSSRM